MIIFLFFLVGLQYYSPFRSVTATHNVKNCTLDVLIVGNLTLEELRNYGCATQEFHFTSKDNSTELGILPSEVMSPPTLGLGVTHQVLNSLFDRLPILKKETVKTTKLMMSVSGSVEDTSEEEEKPTS